MLASHKAILIVGPLLVSLSGCSAVLVSETPESWGKGAGEYAASEWIKNNGSGNWPTTDSTAIYCITISDDGQKKYGWDFQQHLASVDACTKAFVNGLS